ncbi:MAG: peptidyl-prolyl cis-trans isomerase SurA [Sphingobacteriales bacterium]|jgi:peptidyl-prolyl cis-trans isomerase SurA
MKKFISSVFIIVCGLTSSNNTLLAQENATLLEIGNEKISSAEFLRVYKKNNIKGEEVALDEKSLSEYLDLYTKFRLKVQEAETLGMDSSKAFKTELNGYRRQLARPYLTDNENNERLIREAYNRMKEEINAAHILITVELNASPADTLKAFNKIKDIKNKVISGKADFSEMAKKFSDDKGSGTRGGELGYFSAFTMVYPFETAAYTTEPGQVSNIFKTRFGYHIVKVNNKRKARGEIKVAHILIRTQNDEQTNGPSAEEKANDIYNQLMDGADFGELASKYSEDKRSATMGGELGFFGTGKMIPEFEDAAFALTENGEISKPIESQYGLHVIKRIDFKPLETYEALEPTIKTKISSDSRSEINRQHFIDELKKEYSYRAFPENLNAMAAKIGESYLTTKWAPDPKVDWSAPLFNLDGKDYIQKDFAEHMAKSQKFASKENVDGSVRFFYPEWEKDMIIKHEDGKLEAKYPEFRNIMNEYHDGILLFELNDKMVWSKAVKDSAGLRKFYENNKLNYMYGQRADAYVYTTINEKTAKKAAKFAKKGKMDSDAILNKYNKDQKVLFVESGKFEKGENSNVDAFGFKAGISEIKKAGDNFKFTKVSVILGPQPKPLDKVRGKATADFQDHLEKEWVETLKKKYPVKVNDKAFQKLVKN